MKIFKRFTFKLLILLIVVTIIQCTSIPKLEKEAPTEFEDVYFQKWNAGTKEGGSGINIYLDVKDASVALDSVYFRGQVAKLERNSKNKSVLVGRFKSIENDITVTPKQVSNALFQLEYNECVISYLIDQNMLYFKVSNLMERTSINYPASFPNGN